MYFNVIFQEKQIFYLENFTVEKRAEISAPSKFSEPSKYCIGYLSGRHKGFLKHELLMCFFSERKKTYNWSKNCRRKDSVWT